MPWSVNQTDGALVLEFGKGDLVIGAASCAEAETVDELVIWPKSPGPIGDLNPDDIGKSTADVKALVRLVFQDPRSLDVLIHQANHLRELMNGAQKWTAEEHDKPKLTITDEQLEELGRLADQAGNLAAASQMPVSPHIHIEGMRHGLTSIEAALKELYVAVSGDNPWNEQ